MKTLEEVKTILKDLKPESEQKYIERIPNLYEIIQKIIQEGVKNG